MFIDDNMREGNDDPFVRAVAKLVVGEAKISVFLDSKKGLDYVLNNLSHRMIVFLDCKFDGYDMQGIDVLKKIRERTSLLYVVMMSANNVDTMSKDAIIEMINEEFISFFDRNNGTAKDACYLIENIKKLWNVRFDCVLESWINRHPEDADKCVYKELGGKSYTWSDILDSLRKQTEPGKSFEKMVNEFYIFQLPEQD